MGLINFYPGPSRVDSQVPKYVSQAYKDGLIGVNHRSDLFMNLVKKTGDILRDKLEIPKDYEILFVSSATECWEIVGQSFVTKKSYHLSYGAFAQKWINIHKNLGIQTDTCAFDLDEELDMERIKVNDTHEVICATQNETSNGTQINGHNLQKLRLGFPDHLIAVDATSSMAGIYLNFELGDIWFSSVQKCFGLPAGMAVIICSPKAIAVAEEVNENKHYNSFIKIYENMLKYQTHYTPNILDIYLLNKVMGERKGIDKVGQETLKRYNRWVKFISTFSDIGLLVENDKTRSRTVIVIEAEPNTVEKLLAEAKDADILLGKGYADLVENTVRVANFPAIKKSEITYLRTFFEAELI